ncbi:MAG: 2-iminoacetate synthase ThiH, partial [Elusimicrobia bacterium]|nr:2-iminoacetate synthase ThiH [Elusimicrobiota bacterium]
ISVSFPRICKGASSFKSVEVSDIELAQVVAAFRIFMQRAGITLSTREKAVFRNNILPFGITKMSAGCETSVGGYSGKGGKGQFEMSDKRSVAQIKQALLKQGYQPVFKNWDIL